MGLKDTETGPLNDQQNNCGNYRDKDTVFEDSGDDDTNPDGFVMEYSECAEDHFNT